MFIPESTAIKVNEAKDHKRKVCAIGTTSMKAVESATTIAGKLKPYDGWTNKFIFPPYEFSVANAMITNLHLPMSSMLMMVSAFGGYDFVMKAYKEAVKKKFKFFTYGDAMLII